MRIVRRLKTALAGLTVLQGPIVTTVSTVTTVSMVSKVLAIGFLTGLLLVGCDQGDKEPKSTPPSQIVGKLVAGSPTRPPNAIKAPDFTLNTINGRPFSLHELEGKVVLLNFWAIWCAPCRREIPDLIQLHRKYNPQGLEIVGVSLDKVPAETVAAFVRDWNMNYTVLIDGPQSQAQEVVSRYGQATGRPITGIPTTFIIDREGYIVKGYIGPRSEEVFYQDLKPYL